MSKNFDSIFTRIEDLTPEERKQLMTPGPEPYRTPSDDSKPAVNKTPVSILEEFSRKLYQQSADYSNGYSDAAQIIFEVTCKVSDLQTTGTGKTKKAAKHMAAADMLRALVNKNLLLAKIMGIPCDTTENALKYIDTISTELAETKSPSAADEVSSDFSSTINYIGDLQQLCAKEKLNNPIYEDSSEGPPNDMTFTVRCTVAHHHAEGRAKQKKLAKTLSAFKMLDILKKGLAEMREEMDLDNDAPIDDYEDMKAKEEIVAKIEDPIQALKGILEEDRFDIKSMEYRDLTRQCSIGMEQCLLTITCSRNGEPETTNVYPGAGYSHDEAKQEAARIALIHFKTF